MVIRPLQSQILVLIDLSLAFSSSSKASTDLRKLKFKVCGTWGMFVLPSSSELLYSSWAYRKRLGRIKLVFMY